MEGRGLVKMSAVMFEVEIQVVTKEPSFRCWRIKWCRTSMCFVLDEMESVLAMVQVLWLSQRIWNGVGEGSMVSERKSLIQIASLMVLVSA